MDGSIKWVIGLDAHSRICEACVMDTTGDVIEPVGFQTSALNLIKLAHRFPEAVFVLEESTMAQWFVETLSSHAAEVFVSEPKQNKWITSGMKSDRLDAYKLATMYRLPLLRQRLPLHDEMVQLVHAEMAGRERQRDEPRRRTSIQRHCGKLSATDLSMGR